MNESMKWISCQILLALLNHSPSPTVETCLLDLFIRVFIFSFFYVFYHICLYYFIYLLQFPGARWRRQTRSAALRTGESRRAQSAVFAERCCVFRACRDWGTMLQVSSCESAATETDPQNSLSRGSSVSELVKSYDDGSAGKRDRSESGDSAPLGKRRPPDSSPRQSRGEVKALIDDAIEGIEDRLSVFLSKELHEFKNSLLSKFEALDNRIQDLEEHVNTKDIELEKMSTQLQQTQEELKRLHDRTERAEMNSRIPCLVLSGRALAPRPDRHLAAPLPVTGMSAPPGSAAHGPAGSSGARGGGGSAEDGRRGDRAASEGEDINGLVVGVVRERFKDLNFTEAAIDRAHRLPGPNHRVIIRFVQSGAGSIRDQLMTRRMELRGRDDLFINESLTEEKGQIYHALLAAKKEGKIYTVFTRWGNVFYKTVKFGTNSRVESLDKLRQLGFAVKR